MKHANFMVNFQMGLLLLLNHLRQYLHFCFSDVVIS